MLGGRGLKWVLGWPTAAALGCVLGLLLNSPVWADEVHLQNGDRLTGTIVTMEEEVLTVQTPHSGDVKIQWPQVRRLSADKPLTIQLHEKVEETDWTNWLYTLYATTEAREIGAESPLALAAVKAINPLPPIRYQGTLNIGGNRTQGNTDTQALNASTRWTIRSDRHRLLTEGKFNYGEVNNVVTVRNFWGSFKYDYFLSKKVFTNAEALLEKDTFQNLSNRTTLGSGLGYQFLETPRATIAAVGGLAYVSEHYINAPSVKTPSARWGLRTEFVLVPDRIRFFHKHEAYYDFGERGALRVIADQGMRVTLVDSLFVNVEYDLRYNGAPAPGRRRTDEAMILGIGYEFRQ